MRAAAQLFFFVCVLCLVLLFKIPLAALTLQSRRRGAGADARSSCSRLTRYPHGLSALLLAGASFPGALGWPRDSPGRLQPGRHLGVPSGGFSGKAALWFSSLFFPSARSRLRHREGEMKAAMPRHTLCGPKPPRAAVTRSGASQAWIRAN